MKDTKREEPAWDREEVAKGMDKYIRDKRIMQEARGAECHHHLIESYDCFNAGLYIASSLCSITFIEITARYLKAIIETHKTEKHVDIDKNTILNRKLLLELKKEGVNVETLAVEEKETFRERLNNNTNNIEISKIRNNICHGNYSNYFEDTEAGKVFTPYLVKEDSSTLLYISEKWLSEFSRYKKEVFGI